MRAALALRLPLALCASLAGCYGDMVVAESDRSVVVSAPTVAWRPAREPDLVGFWQTFEVSGASAGAVLKAYAFFGAGGEYSSAALVVDEEGRPRFAVLADDGRWSLGAEGLDLHDGSPPLQAFAAEGRLRLVTPDATMSFDRVPVE